MRSRKFLAAAVSAAGGALAAGLAVPAALAAPAAGTVRAASGPAWHVAYQVPAGWEIQGITAPAPGAAWAFGTVYSTRTNALIRPFYLHWDGRSWKTAAVPGPAGFEPLQIAASSPGDVWIFGTRPVPGGYAGTALIYDGRHWGQLAAPMPGGGAIVGGPADVWLADEQSSGPAGWTTVVDHWTGGANWQSYTLPGALTLAGAGGHPWLAGLSGTGGQGGQPDAQAVYQWNGTAWQPVPAPGATAASLVAVASATSRAWILTAASGMGPWKAYARVSGHWSKLPGPPAGFATAPGWNAPVYDGGSGFWSLPWHWTGSRWVTTIADLPPAKPWWFVEFWYDMLAKVPGSSGVWAVMVANPLPPRTSAGSSIGYYGNLP